MATTISQKYNDEIQKSKFPYFVHLRRSRGFFGFKREHPLVFPHICAYCGSSDVFYESEIGRPELNIYRGIGKVPYCKEHAQPIKSQKDYKKIIWTPFAITVCIAMAYSLFMQFSQSTNHNLITLLGLLVVFLSTLTANAAYIHHNNKKVLFNSAIDSNIIEIGLELFFMAALFVLIVFILTVHNNLLKAAGLALILLWNIYLRRHIYSIIRNNNGKGINIESYVQEEARHYTAVACVHYDLQLYTLGFSRKNYYDEFCKLNDKQIEGKSYHSVPTNDL
jgi:hypothetical protein